MITVKATGNGDFSGGPCAGKHQIEAKFGSTADIVCDGGMGLTIVNVWVSTSYSTIEQAYAAGATIYDENDCSQCAPEGYYMSNGLIFDPHAHHWKGCTWQSKINCSAENVGLKRNNDSTRLCDDIGISVVAYVNNGSFAASDGLWSDATLTTTYNGVSNTWYKEPGQPEVRKWITGTNGGFFEQTTLCPGGPGGGSTRYEHGVSYNLYTPTGACDGTMTTVWADAQNYSNATEHWESETGSSRPPAGYYVSSLVELGGSNDIRQANSSGQLSDSGYACESSEGPGEGPGEEPGGPGEGFAP